MAESNKALETMVKNIEAKTGKTMKQLATVISKSKLTKHGEIRSMLMEEYGLGHGAANTVVHLALKSDGQSAAEAKGLSSDQILDGIYSDKKAHLRPIHDRILKVLESFGDYEVAPKKGYVSYRRKKQFTMVGPKTATQVEVGLAAKKLPSHPRLKEMPPASMCRYATRLSSVAEVDKTLEGWLRTSFDEAE
jgi:hypothetical protein